MAFPKTLQEFQATFPNEKACWEALRQARWPHGFVCPRCGHTTSSWISTRRLEQCCRCRDQCSVTAGTVFHRTRIPLLSWFWAIFFLARHQKGISALQLRRETGLGSYQTAWTLLHKLRSALRHRPQDRLVGLVEVDETYVGGHKRGRRGGREVLNKVVPSRVLDEALDRYPDEPMLWLLHTEALLAQGRSDDAHADFRRFRETTFDGDPQIEYLRARLELAEGNPAPCPAPASWTREAIRPPDPPKGLPAPSLIRKGVLKHLNLLRKVHSLLLDVYSEKVEIPR